MLELKKIVKNYEVGDTKAEALKGIDLAFRDNEFVSILGPSGCGKTTTLNIIGGLDRYTSGDLIINGRSTKEFKDADWDAYRNHSVGFVFQSYNLIPHQTVLSNVELALTLSGVSKIERKKRAREALEQVGLGDHIHKRPNQLSGGQMQRVAIARALVNDPDILLADEPTGALDTATSVQIMEIIKEISHNKLIIMVTHNPDLAKQYSTRIVQLLDGEVVNDTNPYTPEMVRADQNRRAAQPKPAPSKGKKSMSFLTALSLSMNNLLTKKGRTFMTSFAGSIGIIGIALILALSTGVQYYINDVQRDTLSAYPVSIMETQSSFASMMSTMAEVSPSAPQAETEFDDNVVYENTMMSDMFNMVFSSIGSENNLADFKKHIDEELTDSASTLSQSATAIQYQYDIKLNNYVRDVSTGEYRSCDLGAAFSSFASSDSSSGNSMYSMMSTQMSSMDLWQEMLSGSDGELISDVVKQQYDLLQGEWPTDANEIVLILGKNNKLSDVAFYALGLESEETVNELFRATFNSEKVDMEENTATFDELSGITFKMLLSTDFYADNDGDGVYEYIGDDETLMKMKLGNAYELKISGIIRPNEEASSAMLTGTFGYTSALTEYVIDSVNDTEIVAAQQRSDENLLTGMPFELEQSDLSDSEKASEMQAVLSDMTTERKAQLYRSMLTTPRDDYTSKAVEQFMEQYPDRDSRVELIAESYNLDKETVTEYLESYSDTALETMLRQQITEMVNSSYAASGEKAIDEILNTPSEEELAGLVAQITSQLPDAQTKIGFVAAAWAESTDMDAAAIMQYLMGLSAEQLDSAVYGVAAESAADTYAQLVESGMAQSDSVLKLSAALDEVVGADDTEETLAALYDLYAPSTVSNLTKEEVLEELGVFDKNSPSVINIYTEAFEDHDKIAEFIADYNSTASDENEIEYTDYIALLMSGITSVINSISYGLIAFVSISLVVSSIMIGIITYISVLERTREIGVLRSIGASKRDISRVFNAETLIVGFAAGAIGIIVSLLVCIPLNLIIHAASGITSINAQLPIIACVILVGISMILTFIAGLIPSGVAAKKDPVEALRSE